MRFDSIQGFSCPTPCKQFLNTILHFYFDRDYTSRNAAKYFPSSPNIDSVAQLIPQYVDMNAILSIAAEINNDNQTKQSRSVKRTYFSVSRNLG